MTKKDIAELSSNNIIAPPPYEETERSPDSDDEFEDVIFEYGNRETAHAAESGGLELPCVIPQITKTFKGAFYSPFARAYAPALQAHGITKEDFVTFIDGLNECFIAHPAFRAAGFVGAVLTMAYGVHPVQWAGMGLQVASGVVSAATSYARTRAYVKAMNGDLFHSAGLHLHILTTKKMLEKIGHPDAKISLPSLDEMDASGAESSEPLLRRLKALEGYATPLDFDVPDMVEPDNLLRKMGASQAAKDSRKQSDKMLKKREKLNKREDRIERAQSRGEARVERLENAQATNAVELESRLASASSEGEAARIQKEFERKNEKLDSKIQKRIARTDRRVEKRTKKYERRREKVDKKEGKTANKVRWIVIVPWSEDTEDSDVDSLPSSEEGDSTAV